MKDLSIVQHQAQLEEKADNEQQLRHELSMVAHENDAKHGDVNSRQVAYQEDDNLKLHNENIQEYKELYTNRPKHTFHLHWRFWIRSSSKNCIVWLRTHTEKTHRYIANLQSIFDISEEKVQFSQDHDMLDGSVWEYRTANTSHVADDQFESFHAKVKQKWERHLNEYEGKFTVDPVGTYSVSSQHEVHHEDNQRKKMKSNEELIQLLQTETPLILVTNEQSLIRAKPILKTSSRRGDPVNVDIGKMRDRVWFDTSEHSTRYLDMADGGTNVDTAIGTNDNS